MAAKTRKIPEAGEGKRGTQGHVGYLLRQAHGALRSALDAAFAKAALTTPQFLVLTLLDAYPGASGADIARIAQLTPQTVNLIVRKLAAGRLLGRNEHETHGRVLRLALTTAGRVRLAQCKRRAAAVERDLLAGVDAVTEAKIRAWLVSVATRVRS
jgi:DNA-binding MarR family transcriptional regulator